MPKNHQLPSLAEVIGILAAHGADLSRVNVGLYVFGLDDVQADRVRDALAALSNSWRIREAGPESESPASCLYPDQPGDPALPTTVVLYRPKAATLTLRVGG